MKSATTFTAMAALMLAAGTASAQTSSETAEPSRQQERLNSIFGALFGDRAGSTTSIEAQWTAGRTPLATQRAQFETRVDTDVRSGALRQTTGTRLKSDYADLVQLEARYGADRRFTSTERNDLADRYGALTQVLADGSYGDNDDDARSSSVADGQAEFVTRVNSQISGRRLTRTAGNRLKADYAALVQTEASYLRDGRLSSSEGEDLDARLDALDERVGDVGYTGGGATVQTPRIRLDAVARALSASGLSASAQAQLRVEHEDLLRLDAAYARLTPTSDERAYLERRVAELETRARIRR